MNLLNFSLQLAGPNQTSFIPVFPSQQCQVNDGGVIVVVQVLDSNSKPVNLRPATSLKIILVRPSGVSIETTATFYTNGFDGKMELTTASAIPYGTGLDEAGIWQIQGRIVTSGNTQFTVIGSFSVNSNLGA